MSETPEYLINYLMANKKLITAYTVAKNEIYLKRIAVHSFNKVEITFPTLPFNASLKTTFFTPF